MGDFEVDTRLTPVEAEEGCAQYRATLSQDWEIWGPNGGYVAAIALRAAGQLARVPRPASFFAHFLSVARFDEIDVEVRVLKAGRRAESLAVSLRQAGRPILEALVRTAAEGPGLEHDVATPPDVRPAHELRSPRELMPEEEEGHPFWQNFEVRPVWPERFAEERTARPPEYLEWYRFHPRATFEDPWLDAARSLMMIDTASWIAACQPHPEAPFTAPNIDVSAWFHRAEPQSAWLLMDQRCPVAEGGLMGTNARIWSESGQLLASGGAQLFCVPAPPQG